MKAVILAGGLGTRLSEETQLRPKPMAEIGGKPVLWHILKIYSSHGINDFVICLGYKGYMIKEYFANYFLHTSDVTFDMANNDKTRAIALGQEIVRPMAKHFLEDGAPADAMEERRIRTPLDEGIPAHAVRAHERTHAHRPRNAGRPDRQRRPHRRHATPSRNTRSARSQRKSASSRRKRGTILRRLR